MKPIGKAQPPIVQQWWGNNNWNDVRIQILHEKHPEWYLVKVGPHDSSEVQKWLKSNFISTKYYYFNGNIAIFVDKHHAAFFKLFWC
jgi:hypothetical protein